MEQAYRYDYYARLGEWQKIVSHARTLVRILCGIWMP
jgi:hypothetical protein